MQLGEQAENQAKYQAGHFTGGRLSVDLDALIANWRHMSKQSGNARSSAVVKANAYGLGIEPVVGALWGAGCRTFFVAMLEEAMRARKMAGEAQIFVLNGLIPGSESIYAEFGITPVLCSRFDVERWAQFCQRQEKPLPCALHVDTGINRMGLSLESDNDLPNDERLLSTISPILLMSHLACGDDAENAMNERQRQRFLQFAKPLMRKGTELSLANSAGIALGPDYHFSLTRPGIALYGGEFSNLSPALRPVVTLEGRIMQIRRARKGEAVGYGAAAKLERDSRIAIVAIGYGDGYPRALSGHGVPLRQAWQSGGQGMVAGIKVRIIGRISMDMITFDVTDVPEEKIREHDWIELIGSQVLVDDVARASGTISYEVLTGLGQRYQRQYVLNGKTHNSHELQIDGVND